jgi:hypothetical protein
MRDGKFLSLCWLLRKGPAQWRPWGCYGTCMQLNSTVFWDVAPCNLILVYQRFGGTYCLHLQVSRRSRVNNDLRKRFCLPPASYQFPAWLICRPWRRRQHFFLKYWYTSTRLHGVTQQNATEVHTIRPRKAPLSAVPRPALYSWYCDITHSREYTCNRGILCLTNLSGCVVIRWWRIVSSSSESYQILFSPEHGNLNTHTGDFFHHTGVFFLACSRAEIFQAANTRYNWSKWHVNILHMKASLRVERMYSPVILYPALWGMLWRHALQLWYYLKHSRILHNPRNWLT